MCLVSLRGWCVQVLDPENRGYIDEHTMHELLTENEWAFRDKEVSGGC